MFIFFFVGKKKNIRQWSKNLLVEAPKKFIIIRNYDLFQDRIFDKIGILKFLAVFFLITRIYEKNT